MTAISPKTPRALWVSTSLSTRGGISTFVRNMRHTDLWRDWHICHVATHRNGGIPTRIMIFALGFGNFVCQLIFKRPHIVHIHMSSYGSFARKFILMWTAKGFRVPVVVHIHGSRFNTFFETAPRPVRVLVRTTLEHADAVIALGNSWAAELQRMAPGARIDVVANAIRPIGLVQQTTSDPVHVVFLGEIGERKGTFVLLEAWAKVIECLDVPLARLTIAGDGDVGRARHLVSTMGIEANVDVSDWLSETEVAALLSDAQVLVLPSMNEGQPMAILEAMSRGMCVIASNVGGIPELLGESGGILIDPVDVDALATALLNVVTDGDVRSQYGAAALRRVEDEFNIDTASYRIDKLYRRIMERRGVPASGARRRCWRRRA